MPVAQLRQWIPALALLLLVALVFSPASVLPASLATDAGLTDQDVCASVVTAGPHAVDRLEQSGFPRATTGSVEIYRLARHAGGDAWTTEAQVEIDWAARTARCLPADYAGPADVTFQLKPRAYDALVAELRHVLETGEPSGHVFGNWLVITLWTDVSIHNNEAYAPAYERTLAKWAAGRLVQEVRDT